MTDLLRSFSLDDQRAFAAFSGDFNPMHLDPHYARRLAYGAPLVHGAHLVLWAVESLLESPQHIYELTSQFRHPVRIGDKLSAEVRTGRDGEVKITILAQGRTACSLSARSSHDGQWNRIQCPHIHGEHHPAQRRQPAHMQALGGNLAVGADHVVGEKLFPRLYRAAPGLAQIIATASRLVGMECPGLNSIFSELKLRSASRSCQAPGALTWKVSAFDERFSRAVIDARTSDSDLELIAFVRPEAQPQPSCTTLAAALPRQAYAERRALVVGGSRGLGELCAKMLAVGGADVCISYRTGRDDAAAVLEDIESAGYRAQAIQFDVLSSSTASIRSQLDWRPTHLYYFATPPIFVATRQFSREIFHKFCDYYVTGFVDTVHYFRDRGALRVFYPSTVAIDDPPPDMGEYVAAKVAGEAVCQQLAALHPGISVDIERLPRLPTDQTATVFPVETEEPVAVMRAILDRL